MSFDTDSQPSQASTITLMDGDRHEVIYFAYGSNLSTDQMLHRCPSSVPVGLGHLPGWRWIINERGYANIVQVSEDDDSQAEVYGLLYLLPPDDEASLDMYEGVPYAYKKYKIDLTRVKDELGKDVEEGQQQKITALVYVDDERVEGNVPREEYVFRMETGITEAVEDWGMTPEYAAQLRSWLHGDTQP